MSIARISHFKTLAVLTVFLGTNLSVLYGDEVSAVGSNVSASAASSTPAQDTAPQTPREFFDSIKKLPPEERAKAIQEWRKNNTSNANSALTEEVFKNRQKQLYDIQIEHVKSDIERLNIIKQKIEKSEALPADDNAVKLLKEFPQIIELRGLELDEIEFRKGLLDVDAQDRYKLLLDRQNSDSFKRLEALRKEYLKFLPADMPNISNFNNIKINSELQKSLEGKTPQERREITKKYFDDIRKAKTEESKKAQNE